jgi:hypothetical protein
MGHLPALDADLMVKILTPEGADLVATPPADQVYSSVNNQTVYNLQVQIVESNPLLPVQNLTGTIHWNDGGLPTVVNGVGTIQVDELRTLYPGTYLIGVAAHNYEVGVPSSAQVNFAVRILPAVNVNPGRPVIYGQGRAGDGTQLRHQHPSLDFRDEHDSARHSDSAGDFRGPGDLGASVGVAVLEGGSSGQHP